MVIIGYANWLEMGANIEEIDLKYINFFVESNWIVVNQNFRDFNERLWMSLCLISQRQWSKCVLKKIAVF